MSILNLIKFIIHNEEHTVSLNDIAPDTTLLQYLREYEHLKGTKYMCLEGGCGACIVAVTAKHPITKRTVTFAVNSCLVSIYMCGGWKIHTVDGIGNGMIGYHPIQETLANFNGTQCGFCSPGMVMNMFALYEEYKNLTKKQVEDSFGSNMCRCTGYRSILSAFKSLASDTSANDEELEEIPDIEDLKPCGRNQNKCQYKSTCKMKTIPASLALTKSKWFKVYSINEIFDVFQQNPGSSYQLVGGNTAKGVYPRKSNPDLYIDVSSVPALLSYAETSDKLIVGAGTTLTDTIDLFEKVAKGSKKFAYLTKLADHIKMVAHVAVRNIGTLAGNLTIKHNHHEFPSDIFLILETIGAKLTIATSKRTEKQLDLLTYFSFDMNRKVIKNIIFPSLPANSYKYGSYKIMQRAQNTHALVNAGFLIELHENDRVQSARIVYGNINPSFVHATKAERYLVYKNLFDNKTLQGTFAALDEDLHPDQALYPLPGFRKQLAIALFYKFVLNNAPDSKLSPENKSGKSILTRPISTGVQDFQSNESRYPLTKPIRKLEALRQTSGELEYITDIPDAYDQLFAYFVTANAPANSVITKVDASDALKMDDVVAFYDKNDIPGSNAFIPLDANFPVGFFAKGMQIVPEELFCSGTVLYYFQPVGVVVAKSQKAAEEAALLVKVSYSPGKKKPLLTIRQVLEAGNTNKVSEEDRLERQQKDTDVKHVVKGTYDTSWQYHYHMETQICIVVPKEDYLNIYPSTQWMDIIQTAVARVLNIPENKINIEVARLGGGFGAKISRNSLLTCATALAAYKLQKPVKMRMTFSTNMDVIGKRYPSAADYEVGLNDKGEIQYLDNTFYLDYATGGNETIISKAIGVAFSSYNHDTWEVIGNYTKTDNHAGVWMRAPGSNNMLSITETIMEHVAMELNIPSLEIRLANMDRAKNKKLINLIDELRQWADYDNRLNMVQKFNKENRWMKKALSLVPMTYPIGYLGSFSAMVVIYASDGTVAVTHGGIEIGQGINTKVAQVCAFALGISLDMVSVKSSNNLASPNNFTTGASITSEVVCYATLRACESLLERMNPVKNKLKNPTWQEWVKECHNQYVELIQTHMFSPNDPPEPYDVYGVCASEVIVDILTGVHQITRVDLLEDTGESMSPYIDIGQVEGAFVMGLGFWTTERVVFDENGKLLTNRTWNYKIPGAQDIPIDFRVKFLKNSSNSKGILHAKATAEPPLCLAVTLPIAIRQAVASARQSANSSAKKWYPFRGPSDVQNTFLNSLNDYKQYVL